LRIGFLGVAHSHGPEKVRTVRESGEWEFIGAAEPNAAVRERLKDVPFLSREEVLERAEVIAVESAVLDHARDAEAALRAGKHVHLEKPPATNMAELKALLALAAENERLVQMGYMWRYNPGVIRILEAAREGWLGKVHAVRGVINTKVGDADRKVNAQFAGGTLFELGCHLIDPIARMLGRPQAVAPFLQHLGPPADGFADNCLAVMQYDGVLATVASSALQPGAHAHRSLEVVGTNGIAILRPIEQPTLVIELAKAAGPYAAGKQTVALPQYRRYAPEFADLASAIREGRPLGITHEEELLVQETILQCCRMMPA
jgi:predicted dehydrogenase